MFLILVCETNKLNNQEAAAASWSNRPTEIEGEKIGEVTTSFAAAAAKVISMTAAIDGVNSAMLMLFYCTRMDCVASG